MHTAKVWENNRFLIFCIFLIIIEIFSCTVGLFDNTLATNVNVILRQKILDRDVIYERDTGFISDSPFHAIFMQKLETERKAI